MNDTRAHRGVVLIGLRGSGKSTLGRLVAEATHTPFVDLDDRTAEIAGFETPGAALRALGEAQFREAEVDALRAVLDEPPCVLALGGGTPTAHGAAEMLAACARPIVYLRATPATLRARLAVHGATDRPSLTGRGTLDEIDEVFAVRDPVYTGLALSHGEIIDTDTMNAETAIEAVRHVMGV